MSELRDNEYRVKKSTTDCVQKYPIINGIRPKLLKKISESQRPDDWPQTWCKDATYARNNIEIGINTIAEQDIYGVTGWRVWIKQSGEVSTTRELIETQNLDEAISVIKTKLESIN